MADRGFFVRLACILFTYIAIFFGVVMLRDLTAKAKERKETTTVLYNINRTTESSGHFFLGHGNVKGKQYFVAYTQNEDGGLVLYKMDAEKVTVYQTLKEDESAYVVTIKNGLGEILEMKLYVPENTIIQEYKLSE